MITSIPELIAKHGNMADCCRATGINEMTIAKYRFDVKCERHVIYKGRLMSNAKNSRPLYTRRGVTKTERANGL